MFVPGSSPQVKILRLDGMFLHYLPVDPGMLSLEILQLKGVNFMDFNQTSALLCLLASALNLQQLHIEAASTNNPNQELQVSSFLKHQLDYKSFPLSKLHFGQINQNLEFYS